MRLLLRSIISRQQTGFCTSRAFPSSISYPWGSSEARKIQWHCLNKSVGFRLISKKKASLIECAIISKRMVCVIQIPWRLPQLRQSLTFPDVSRASSRFTKTCVLKANMSGEFTVVNKYLVEDLKKLGLWDTQMLEEIKYFDGSVQHINRIPEYVRAKYKEAFELDPEWLLILTAVRSKWIDQSQSHNVFMKGVSGKLMHDIYMTAWKLGLKCTYYLRTLGASQIEKSTLDAKKYGYTQKRQYDSQEEVGRSSAVQPTVDGTRVDRSACGW